jgi:hypothetical protein
MFSLQFIVPDIRLPGLLSPATISLISISYFLLLYIYI